MTTRRRRYSPPRSGRRARGGGSLLLPGVLLVFMVAMAGGGLWYFQSVPQPEPPDAQTLCPANGPTSVLAVLIDVSTPVSTVQARRLELEIERLLRDTPEGGMVSVGIAGPEGPGAPLFARCRPPRGAEVSGFTANPAQVEGRFDEQFARPLNRALEGALARAQDPRVLVSAIKGATVRDTGSEVVITLGEAITFDSGQSVLRSEAAAALGELAQALQGAAGLDLLIVGHTDDRGDTAANQTLSERRAEAVAEALALAGLSSDRLRAQGRSFREPVATNDTPEGRAANRRVEVIVAGRSPIMESLQALVANTPGMTADMSGDRRLVLATDLIQNSAAFSFYRGEGWSEFVASPAYARMSRGLDGIVVTVLRVARHEAQLQDPRLVEDFWQRYLQVQGAQVAPPRVIGDL